MEVRLPRLDSRCLLDSHYSDFNRISSHLFRGDRKPVDVFNDVFSLCVCPQVELKFPAPSKTGNYQYSVILRSDSYLGLDQIKPLKVSVCLCVLCAFATLESPERACVIKRGDYCRLGRNRPREIGSLLAQPCASQGPSDGN